MYSPTLIMKKGFIFLFFFKKKMFLIFFRKDSVLPGSKHPNYMKRNTKLTIE